MGKEVQTAGVVIINERDEILLVKHTSKAKHKDGRCGIPAGKLAEGEAAIDCALRELEEETGLSVAEDALIRFPGTYGSVIMQDGKALPFSMTIFYVKRSSGKLRPAREGMPEWIPISRLGDISLLPNIEKLIIDARRLGLDK